MTLDKAFVLSEPISPFVKWKQQQYMPHRGAVRISRRLWSVFLGVLPSNPQQAFVQVLHCPYGPGR